MDTLHEIEYAIDAWSLRVTDIKQYDYCRRVVFYEYCLPGVRPETYKMQAGIGEQDRIAGLEERRSLRAYGVAQGERHFNVNVASQKLPLVGQIDMVIETSEGGHAHLIPVDFKLSRREPGRHFKLQLAAYALLLEENWGLPVEHGAIYLIPLKRVIKVPIMARLRKDVIAHLAEIRGMIETEQMPAPTTQRSRCVNCEFRRFCNDVL
jgi:CRISPR-associated exonuclease Cas4